MWWIYNIFFVGLTPLKGLTLRDEEIKDSMVCAGPMAKHAKDLAPMLEILLGSNKHLLKLDQEVNNYTSQC